MSHRYNNSIKIGEKLKKYRLQQDLTQAAFARKAGVSVNHYRQIEKGNVAVSILVLRKLCKAAEVNIMSIIHNYPTVGEFFGGDVSEATLSLFTTIERKALRTGRYWMSYMADKYPDLGEVMHNMIDHEIKAMKQQG
ncbi:MAG: helix-turn-helix transcriptional regulator [Patescibacteria group bacterium]